MQYIGKHIVWQEKLVGTRLLDGSIWLGRISGKGLTNIKETHAKVLVRCYIDPSHLHTLAESQGDSPAKLLEDQILPDSGTMKSGDSGEILARSVLRERGDLPVFPVYRWRSRSKRDDTVRGPDLLGYVISDFEQPSDEDVLYICEVKTRASTIKPSIVLDAFQGATENYISDLKNHLFFARQKLLQQGDEEGELRLSRFAHPHNHPYIRRLVPCVVHNDQTWDDSYLSELPVRHGLSDEVEVVVICVPDLAAWIGEVFDLAIAAADDLDALTNT